MLEERTGRASKQLRGETMRKQNIIVGAIAGYVCAFGTLTYIAALTTLI